MKLVVELTEKEIDVLVSLVDLGFRQTGATKIQELTQVYSCLQKAKVEKKVAVPSGPINRGSEPGAGNKGVE